MLDRLVEAPRHVLARTRLEHAANIAFPAPHQTEHVVAGDVRPVAVAHLEEVAEALRVAVRKVADSVKSEIVLITETGMVRTWIGPYNG